MQWEPGYGRRKAGSQDAGSDTSDAWVGELPCVVSTMSTRVAGGGGVYVDNNKQQSLRL